MSKNHLLLIAVIALLVSCATGKKALQKGEFFSAITKAVDRLKSDPDNKKALQVLSDGYPMAINWSQEELDVILSTKQPFKWEKAINVMENVNHLSEIIRRTPAARNSIKNPKSYSSELNMAFEKAAEERYLAGQESIAQNTREAARLAFDHFYKADQLIPNYKDVLQKLETAKELATLKVIVEAITVHTKKYELSSEFFYNQVFEYLNNKFQNEGFVYFYSPQQAEKFKIKQPDFIVQMEFYDFSVGNLIRKEKEQELTKRVKIVSKDTTRIQFKTYKAKLKTYTDEVISEGRLSYKIIDFQTNNLLRDKLLPGSFSWTNKYAIFVGDKQALTNEQLQLTQQKVMPLPPKQDLFIEFTRPIYDQLTTQLTQFFRRYK